MKKRIFSAVTALAVGCSLSVCSLDAFAYGGSSSTSEIGTTDEYTDDLTWSIDGTVLTISGEGPMYNYHRSYDPPWATDYQTITEIIIEEGVTSVGSYCGFCYPELTKVTLPSTCTYIGDYAFSQSQKLESINLPEGITYIGNTAFCQDTALTNVVIPASVTEIGPRAFNGCSGLESITFAEDSQLEKLGSQAFSDCPLITEFVIPDSVTTIGTDMFVRDTALEKIVYGKGLTAISNYAFTNLTALKTFICRGDVTTIGKSAFFQCFNLETVEFPDTVTTINSKAFSYCMSLTEFPNLENVTTVADDAFEKSGVVSAEETDGVIFSAGDVYVTPDYAGKTVSVPITISKNNKFNRAIITLMYDSKLNYTDASCDLMGWLYMKAFISTNTQILGECYTDEDGTLANLTFTLPDDIEVGDSFGVFVTNFEFENSTDITEGYETFSTTGGRIRIVESIQQGDINDDTAVDVKDAVALAKFIKKKTKVADANTSDLNGDGVVNVIDLAMLKNQLQ